MRVPAALATLLVAACSQSQAPAADAAEDATPAPAVQQPAEAAAVKPATLAAAEKPATAEKPAATATPASAKPAAFRPVEVSTTSFVPSAPGKRISHVSVPGPYVAVTFDDGPSATCTPQVLDIFKRHGAHATFFVQGQNAKRNPSLLARAVAEGHEIGSHTWDHINMRASSHETIVSQLDRTAAAIEQATGSAPKVMRPPYGSVNDELVGMVYNRYGTPAILWDVDTNDWRKPGHEAIVRSAVGQAKPGSIILLHDIHPSTVAAVEDVVTGLQARGFKLVTVSQLIALGRQAAGTGAPVRQTEIEEAAPAAEPAPATPVSQPQPEPQAPAADAAPLPEGAASIGTAPAEPATALAAPAADTPLPEGQFFQPATPEP